MKPTFKYMIKGYTGKCDGLVYYYNPKLQRTVCRKLVKQKPTAQNDIIRYVSRNLSSLNISEDYKRDLQHYTFRYTQKNGKDKYPITSWYSIFTMIMWAMARSKPGCFDLATITREEIETQDLPCRTVKQAVEAGLIPPVRDYEWLTNTLLWNGGRVEK